MFTFIKNYIFIYNNNNTNYKKINKTMFHFIYIFGTKNVLFPNFNNLYLMVHFTFNIINMSFYSIL